MLWDQVSKHRVRRALCKGMCVFVCVCDVRWSVRVSITFKVNGSISYNIILSLCASVCVLDVDGGGDLLRTSGGETIRILQKYNTPGTGRPAAYLTHTYGHHIHDRPDVRIHDRLFPHTRRNYPPADLCTHYVRTRVISSLYRRRRRPPKNLRHRGR